MAANDQGQICSLTFSYAMIVQLNSAVDVQTRDLTFTLAEIFGRGPTTTADCSLMPPMDGALLFVPVA